LYWHETMHSKKFYKTDSDFEHELCLTPKQFRRVKIALKALSFLKITLEQNPSKTFYDVDYSALSALICTLPSRDYPLENEQPRPAQKGQPRPAQKGQPRPAQKGQPLYTEITTEKTTEITQNNNTLDEMPATLTKPIGELLSLSLVGLTEKQKAEASVKLSSLSPVQRDLAIQQFNKTVSSGGVKSTPMALLNRLVNLGLQNALESPQIIQPIPSLHPTPKTPAITLEQRENTRAECLKAFVINKKADLLAEFAQKGFVVSRAFGTIIEPDLKLAGLFD
jgi:hypothetical protein